MNINNCIPAAVNSVGFTFLSTQDVRRISVKQITNPQLFDALNNPNLGGLYDPHLGPITHKDICATCKLDKADCPGHYGHIELPLPVYNPLFFPHLFILLRGLCVYCHHFKLSRRDVVRYTATLHLLNHGMLKEADSLFEADQQDSLSFGKNEKSKGTSRKRKARSHDDDSDASEMDEKEQSLETFKEQINDWLRTVFESNPDRSRNDYKTVAASTARRKIISALHKAAISKRKCLNCGAASHRYRKDASIRLLELSLSAKQKASNAALHLHKPSANAVKYRAQAAFPDDQLSRSKDKGKAKEASRGDDEADSSDSDDSHLVESTSTSDSQRRPGFRERSSSSTSNPSDSEGEGDDLVEFDQADAPERKQKGRSKAAGSKQTERLMQVDEVQAHVRLLFANEKGLCDLIYGSYGPLAASHSQKSVSHPDMFFMKALSVTPTRFRPPSVMGDTTYEDPHNILLSNILTSMIKLRDRNDALKLASEKKQDEQASQQERSRAYQLLLDALIDVQHAVNSLIDNKKNPTGTRGGKEPTAGVKQVLEKKEGLFRMNMMVRCR